MCQRNNTQNVFNQGKIGAQLNWLAPLSCVVVNSWWGRLKILQVLNTCRILNHSSVGSSSDKCAFSESGNSAKDDSFSKGGGML